MIGEILAVFITFAWLSNDDKDTAESNEFVLDRLADADLVGKIDCIRDRNLRDQITVGEALELHRDAKLGRMGPERN